MGLYSWLWFISQDLIICWRLCWDIYHRSIECSLVGSCDLCSLMGNIFRLQLRRSRTWNLGL